ncbi:MAG: hypothetical protein Q8941_03560 [Bacteroidota bacterium]|nr:hypothetical protein [Bacteroidota bacterium]
MVNKKYKTVTYSVAIELPKYPQEVFNHLTNLKKWWPEDFEGEDVKLNGEFIFKTGDSHYSKNKVIEFLPDKKLAWMATEAIRKTDGYDWSGSKMIFELAAKGDNTLISITYDGVVFEDEYDRLVTICDMTLKEMFYNFIMNGKEK